MTIVHGAPLSPFVRKVLITLEYKGVDYENNPVIPGAGDAAFQAISPLGKVPVFEDEYLTVPDSSVICNYLDERYPQPSIYPSSPVEKARALWFEEYADTKLVELLGGGLFFELLVAPKLLGRATDDKKVKQTLKALPRFLGYLESQVQKNNFIIAGQFTIADITVTSMFINAQYAGYSVDTHYWPKLAAYLEFVKEQHVFKHRLDEEQEMFKGLL